MQNIFKKEQIYYKKLFSKCRKHWSENSPVRKECLKNSCIKNDDGEEKWICTHCLAYKAASERDVDHIDPIGSNSPKNREEFIHYFNKMDCSVTNLQVLCKKCHKMKTKTDLLNKKVNKMISEIKYFCECFGFASTSVEKLAYSHIKKLHNVSKKLLMSSEEKKEKFEKKFVELLKKYC